MHKKCKQCTISIECPNQKDMDRCASCLQKMTDWEIQEAPLRGLFSEEDWTDEKLMFRRVALLNQVYATNLEMHKKKLREEYQNSSVLVEISKSLAERCGLKTMIDSEEYGINVQAVDAIANVLNGKVEKKVRLLSFATKVCSFRSPAKYHIYDSFVMDSLRAFRREFSSHSIDAKCQEYKGFVEVLRLFCERYNLDCSDPKKLDMYLWSLGQKIRMCKRDKKLATLPSD